MTLPDLFTTLKGQRVDRAIQWSARRLELLQTIVDIEYGRLPPPVSLTASRAASKVDESGASQRQYRLALHTNPPLELGLRVYLPESAGPYPVVLNGDACWDYINPEIISTLLGRGYILATFDRTEIVPDALDLERKTGLYAAFHGMDFGALSAWAWGYQRAVDFLLTLPEVDGAKIAISGHSRGGKTVLLAGATDERIALTNPNDSGCAGAGCFRVQGQGSETFADIVRSFPFWFSSKFPEFIGRENELPFDQHFLKAAVAPRLLLSTEALGDLWANPSGTWHTHAAAQPVYRLLGVPDKIAIWYRQGGHQHSLADFVALLDFADFHFFGRKLPEGYNPLSFG